MTARVLDLDDTSRCPLDDRCVTCGTEDDLGVATGETAVGVHCFTLCGACAEKAAVPSLGPIAAAAKAADHCGHLGCDLDEMAAAMKTDDEQAAVKPLPSLFPAEAAR